MLKYSQVKVMKYHVEAKDNAKFLGSIEKASHCIYLQVLTFHLQIPEQGEASVFSGPRPDEPVADEAPPDHEDDLPGRMISQDLVRSSFVGMFRCRASTTRQRGLPPCW